MQNYQHACMSPPRKVKDLTIVDEKLLDEENERFKVKRIDPASLVSSHNNSHEERQHSPNSLGSSPSPVKRLNSSQSPSFPKQHEIASTMQSKEGTESLRPSERPLTVGTIDEGLSIDYDRTRQM